MSLPTRPRRAQVRVERTRTCVVEMVVSAPRRAVPA
jgi:hypothetical protein